MLIEIAETHPPQNGKKVATVVAAGGQTFEIWPDKLAGLRIGAQYDVDVAEPRQSWLLSKLHERKYPL